MKHEKETKKEQQTKSLRDKRESLKILLERVKVVSIF